MSNEPSGVQMKKFNSFISLCKRAGQLVSGESNCENAIRHKKAELIFLSKDASKNTSKKFNNSAIHYNVPIYILDIEMDEMGALIGENKRSVIVIMGGDFKTQLEKWLLVNTGGGPIA